MHTSMRLKYEPSSEPLHISAKSSGERPVAAVEKGHGVGHDAERDWASVWGLVFGVVDGQLDRGEVSRSLSPSPPPSPGHDAERDRASVKGCDKSLTVDVFPGQRLHH